MQVRLFGCRFQPPREEMQESEQAEAHTRRKGPESARIADAYADAHVDAYVDAQAHARNAHHHSGYRSLFTFV